MIHIFIMRRPAVMLSQHSSKRGFAGADVAGDGYVFYGLHAEMKISKAAPKVALKNTKNNTLV